MQTYNTCSDWWELCHKVKWQWAEAQCQPTTCGRKLTHVFTPVTQKIYTFSRVSRWVVHFSLRPNVKYGHNVPLCSSIMLKSQKNIFFFLKTGLWCDSKVDLGTYGFKMSTVPKLYLISYLCQIFRIRISILK